MEKLYISKTFSKMTGGRSILLILPPWIAPGHKLQTPSNKYGIFQSLGTINSVIFHKRQSQEGKTEVGDGTMPSPLNTLLTALHLFRVIIIIGKESTIAFSAIDKLVALF